MFMVGLGVFVLWMIGLAVIVFYGQTDLELSDALAGVIGNPELMYFVDPSSALVSIRVQEIVVFLIVTGILALNGWRNNELLLKQASATRERENLARYFPPNIVDDLADEDQPFANIRSQSVAVLFADIVGFSRMAEQGEPEKVVFLLREYHKRLEAAVFNNQGTLDKFLGDGIMATFGSPRVGPHDASNAIRCALDMITTVDQWNKEREFAGETVVVLSIGIHYGEVILGDIGSERRLEFATLGDTVNVAARLEEMTRSMDTQVIVSDELVAANKRCGPDNDNHLLDNYSHAGRKQLRGRDSEIGIWKLNAS
jgi:adenylate cyclase